MTSLNFKPINFVLTSTDHGMFILNRNDFKMDENNNFYGVGCNLLQMSSFDLEEIDLGATLLNLARQKRGDGVLIVDCGANIGVHSIEWARFAYGWGNLISIEAQDQIFYALCGNIAINNFTNIKAINAAVGSQIGKLKIPKLNYSIPSNYGGFELTKKTEDSIGQQIDYTDSNLVEIDQITIDSMNLNRLDFLKIDVEGMEMEVLQGAKETIIRDKPYIMIEILKINFDLLLAFMTEIDYLIFHRENKLNVIAFHKEDELFLNLINQNNNVPKI